jgi:hypothetical protein
VQVIGAAQDSADRDGEGGAYAEQPEPAQQVADRNPERLDSLSWLPSSFALLLTTGPA